VKVTFATGGALARVGGKASSTSARWVLGGKRYLRASDDLNGRLVDALGSLDAAIRARDAEIARLQAELQSRSP
jgi:hypothetical protein